MSIPTPPLLAISDQSLSMLFAIIAAAVACGIAFATGVFRSRTIAGPARKAAGEPVSLLWMLVFIGLGTWLIIPSLYAIYAAIGAGHSSATTAPSTAPATSAISSLSPEDTVKLGLFSAAGGLVIMVSALGVSRRGGFARMGWTFSHLLRAVVPAILGVAIVLPLIFSITEFTQRFWEMIGLEHPKAHQLLRIYSEDPTGTLRFMIVISAIVFAPLFEEALFRGLLQTAVLYSIQWLLDLPAPGEPSLIQPIEQTAMPEKTPPPAVRWAAIVLTSILFALVHQELWMMPPIFVLSLCLGYAYERTGNLWVSILLHAAFNTANVILFISQV